MNALINPNVRINATALLAAATPADSALVSISAPAPAPAPTATKGFFSKPVLGKVTVGELGIGGAALGIITKLLKVW